ncbi:hypothetical protein GO986_18840 [Deinococcus sp. HMF7620]|uniref:Uncharacterized protein n=1 Tax=Deinococcus arboris TaxID=2682977 RepID=A0A7C9LX17_9DEIO|nr:hypothetical protein [Deinococcus arboris]MVN88800.1 hypothetical protein [Deinococcus arboris]
MFRTPRLIGALALASVGSVAWAEQYVLSTDFGLYQPATLKATLNGVQVALHHNANGSLDVTSLVKKGKNTLTVEWMPGKNTNSFNKSSLTFGARNGSQWKTLLNRVVQKGTAAGSTSFVFMGNPSAAPKPGKIVVSGKFSQSQPAEFEVALNGEVVASMNTDGNTDLTPFLKAGKNVVTVKYTPGKNTNSYAVSTLTVGQQVGDKWNSLLKWGLGHADTKPGSFTFPLYR